MTWRGAATACVLFSLMEPARAEDASGEPDFVRAFENVREVAHEARVTPSGPGWARVTVTRSFEARDSSSPVALFRGFDFPGDAVVTSLEIETDGTWRPGRLRHHRPIRSDSGDGGLALARDARPWAALEWLSGHQAQIETSMFRVRGRFAIRYALSSRGEPVPRGHRWVFCPDDRDAAAPEVVIVDPSSHLDAGLDVRTSDRAPGCHELVSSEPMPAKLTPRYASYRLGPRAWLWRIELRVPASLLPEPRPPEPGPVVFVLDASRSQATNGGLPTQLAIVRAFLGNAPNAEVELLLVGRTAQRVFGRLVPAADFEPAVPADLVRRPLGNGSFLERGVAMAAEILSRAGRPGRVVIMTDGELRSAFDQRGVIASLRQAPVGTVVHLVYPGNWTGVEVTPWMPEGLAQIAAAFGGAGYYVSVGKRAGPGQEGLAMATRRLLWPDRVESIELHDIGSRGAPEWPPFPNSPIFGSAREVEAGAELAWSAVSPTVPPRRLALTGQIWSRKVELHLRPDAELARELPRLATADDETMNCSTSGEGHRRLALERGFLAPGLVFWVPGSGGAETIGAGGFLSHCSGGLSGHGKAPRPPDREALPQALIEALLPCGLVVSVDRTIVAKVETQRDEVLDVAIKGASAAQQRCAEEALWSGRLPETFNKGRWGREAYEVGLAPAPATGGGARN